MSRESSMTMLIKGGGFALAGIFFSKLAGYIYRIIVARIGTEEYGLFSLALAIFSVGIMISLFGFSTYITRHVAAFNKKKDFARLKGSILFPLKFTISLSLIVSILLIIFSDFIAITIFNKPGLSILIKIVALFIPFDIIRTNFLATMLALKKAKFWLIAKNITENTSKIIITGILVYLGYSILGAAIGYGLGVLISTIFTVYLFTKIEVFNVIKSKIKPIYSKTSMLIYSFPLLLDAFILLFVTWTDTFMLGYFMSASDVGIYNAANPTGQLLYIFPGALLLLSLPVLSEVFVSKDKKSFKSIFNLTTKWIFAVNIILLGLLIMFNSKILVLFFGEPYSTGGLVLIILSVAYFISYCSVIFQRTLMTIKKTNLIFMNTCLAAVTNIILNYVLIPQYGIIGAAIATGTTLVILFVLRFIEALILVKMNPFKLYLLKPVLSGLGIFFVIRYLFGFIEFNIFTFILAGILFSALHILILLVFRFFEKEELVIFKQAQRKFGFEFPRLNSFLEKFVR